MSSTSSFTAAKICVLADPVPSESFADPFESARNAEFMANEVPGIRVPDALMERMRRADGQAAAEAEGIQIAKEISRGLRQMVQGVQVSTQSGNIDAALAVIDGLR